MRLELNFYLSKNELPLDYRRMIVSFFKKTIELYNKGLLKLVYDIGQEKNITFAPFFNPKEFTKDKIILNNGDIKVIISIEDELLGLHFFNAFLQNLEKSYYISENILNLSRVKKLKEKKIENNEATFKIISPLIIREKKDEKKSWYHLLDEEGIKILKRNLISTLKDSFPEKYLNEVEIIPMETKKTVTTFYGIKMQGSLGVIKVSGRKEILNSFYKGGTLSSRKSMGFGLLEVLE